MQLYLIVEFRKSDSPITKKKYVKSRNKNEIGMV